ncbi:MAG: 1,4-alpha-glucan branching protein GlgB [Eubacterium sp.]|nr:1,4-alpha-glucan branching protein GlgB [Eubacterium sp.]
MDEFREALSRFHIGENYEAYKIFGSHRNPDGTITFRVWAPHAMGVNLVGDFNGWDNCATVMQNIGDGCYEVTLSGIEKFSNYKYAIWKKDNSVILKADPYAFHAETNGGTASKVWYSEKEFKWTDSAWARRRGERDYRCEPMNVYEVHLGSWRRYEDGNFYDYRKIADELIPYVKMMGYTHIEVMPLTEYPFDGSWGYQATGYYAITSRYGVPDDFKYLVNKAHRAGIGVFMDWVPAHFPKDDFALARFDGECLYEDPDPLRREHKGWGTMAFDFGRPEIQSFLVSSAMYFLGEYHVDGLRVDAVAAMLYLNYDREDGQWRPNKEGGTENMEARAFLQKLNHAVGVMAPGALMIAEESTAWPMVTMPPSDGGLGFHLKWNMGWMNDTLSYCMTDPYFRKHEHNKLTFPMCYAFSENYMLPISHDEVVHGKKSLLDKMPGDYDQKFAGLREFILYMLSQPGKKLLFMGSELGQFSEWKFDSGLDWNLLEFEKHRQAQEFIRDANHFYLKHREMWEVDHSWEGFQWICADDADRNIVSYRRISKNGRELVFVFNFAPVAREHYGVDVTKSRAYHEIFNTDAVEYGGEGVLNEGDLIPLNKPEDKHSYYLEVTLPPLGGIVLK